MTEFTPQESHDLWLTLSSIARKSMTPKAIADLTAHEQSIDRDTLNQWINELDSEITDDTH